MPSLGLWARLLGLLLALLACSWLLDRLGLAAWSVDSAFLLGTALLGYVCARLTIATRSIWPAIVLHWLIALGWKTLYGIPSCGPAARALCQQ